jgi:hypothetical protein
MAQRVYKSSTNAEAGLVISDNLARLMGNRDNYVMSDNRGTTISGPVSLVAGLDQMRVGGLWTFSNSMQLSLPSTMATPTPVLRIDPPVRQIKELMESVVVMVGLIGGLSAI